MLQINYVKLHPNAVEPTRKLEGDVGYDLVAAWRQEWPDSNIVEYGTGLAVEIAPPNHQYYYVELVPRSGATGYDIVLPNSFGIIDRGYRGELKFRYAKHYKLRLRAGGELEVIREPKIFEVGDRIGQLIIRPVFNATFVELDALSESIRGTGGFGSTGK